MTAPLVATSDWGVAFVSFAHIFFHCVKAENNECNSFKQWWLCLKEQTCLRTYVVLCILLGGEKLVVVGTPVPASPFCYL